MSTSLILASSSPRRVELLQQIGVLCEVHPADIDETPFVAEAAIDLVERLARDKASTVAERHPTRTILAADTVVIAPGQGRAIFGKPTNEAHALDMLTQLSGSTHQVATGLAFYHNEQMSSQTVITDVTFDAISDAEAVRYWQGGEPVGKAGGYAIQGAAARFVTKINGSYSNVVGLPLHETAKWLQTAGFLD